MIQLGNQDEIDKARKDSVNRIVKGYNNPDISRSISPEAFEEKYPKDKFERYSQKAIDKFQEDFMKSEDGDEELLSETITGLEKVIVSDGDFVADMYVREKEAEDTV